MADEQETAVAVATPGDFSVPEVRQQAVNALEGQVLLIQEAMARTLKQGVHYGTIPGTQRPSLWQPGAEMLCQMFGFKTHMSMADKLEDWDNSRFSYTFKCVLSTKSGEHITERFATCSTRERQYQRQISQGQDPAELRETLMLMAQKRAYVAAVRAAGACSAVFTQDDDIVPDQSMSGTPTSTPARSAPSNRSTSGISIPCQLGHAGEFWTSSQYAPAHSARPRWCSMGHWVKRLFDERGPGGMSELVKGIGFRYSKWTDEQYQQFWNNYQAEQGGGQSVEVDEPEPQDASDSLPWEVGEIDEEQLNF